MFDRLKSLFTSKLPREPEPGVYPKNNVPLSRTPAARDSSPRPSAQEIHDAGQKAHDEISGWVDLWAENRKHEIPDKYRPLFSHYLAAFVNGDKMTADQHYATLRTAYTIEILSSWGYPDP